MPTKVNLICGSPILKGLNSKRHNSKSFNSAKSALNHHSVKALKKFTGFFLPFFVAIPIQASSPIGERALASNQNTPSKTQIASKESTVSEKNLRDSLIEICKLKTPSSQEERQQLLTKLFDLVVASEKHLFQNPNSSGFAQTINRNTMMILQSLGFKPPTNPIDLSAGISRFIKVKSKEELTETNLGNLLAYLGATVQPKDRYLCGISVEGAEQELKSSEI